MYNRMIVHMLNPAQSDRVFRALADRTVVRTDIGTLRRAMRLLDKLEALWRGRVDRMSGLSSKPGEGDPK